MSAAVKEPSSCSHSIAFIRRRLLAPLCPPRSRERSEYSADIYERIEFSHLHHLILILIHYIEEKVVRVEERSIYLSSSFWTAFYPRRTGRKEKNLLENIDNYKHSDLDIRNRDGVLKLIKETQPSALIHCAAQPSHDLAANIPFEDFEINALSTLNLLEATRQFAPNTNFIFLSTNKVYGDHPNLLPLKELETRFEYALEINENGIDETMNIDQCTHSLFGVSKVAADLLVQEYGRNFGMSTVCLRGGCLTGPAHRGAKLHGFLSYLGRCIAKDMKYTIFGYKGKQVRDNIHSYDLVNCFWEFYKKPKKKGEVYNIGGGRFSSCSIIEALNEVETQLKINIKKKFIKQNRVGDHIWYISNMKKFKNDYPKWRQKFSTKKILVQLIDEFS